MEEFTKVKSGISGIKKERDQLKTSYDVLTRQLEKVVQDNAAGLRDLSLRSQSLAASVAAAGARASSSQEKTEAALSSFRTETAAIRKRLEEHKATIIDLGERIKKASDSFQFVSKELLETKRSARESEKSLQSIGATISGATGKIAAMGSSLDGRVSTLDQKVSSSISMLRKSADAQSSMIKGHDSALKSATLLLQSLKKDISSSDERAARLREATLSNSKKLEAIGTLESKIKHIEAVKTGLVKGVESLKDIRMGMAALRQKTADLEQRLTGADKSLGQKMDEKAGVLDGKLTQKTAAMEAQVQDKLKFLDAMVTQRAKTLETAMSADLDAMGRSVEREITDMKKLKDVTKKSEGEIRDLRARESASRASDAENKKDLAAMTARIGSLEDMRGRVTEIEKAKDAVIAGIGVADELAKRLSILTEKHKSLEAGASSDIALLKADTRKTSAEVAKVNLTLAGMKKDIERSIQEDIATLRRESRGSGTSAAKMRTDIASLRKAVDLRLSKDVSSLATEMNKWRGDVARIDMDLSGLKKTIGAGLTADVSVLKGMAKSNTDAITKAALDMASLKKDVSAAGKLVTSLKAEHAGSRRRMAALERLTARVKAAEDASKSLALKAQGMAPLSAKIASISKDITALKAASDNSAAVLDERIGYNIAAVKKDSALNSSAVKKLQEDMKKFSIELRSAAKDITAAKAEARAAHAVSDERAALSGGALKHGVDSAAAAVKRLDASLEKITLEGNLMKKDVSAGIANMTKLSSDLSGLVKKSQEMEKIQARLGEMENAKDTMMAALDGKFAERMGFLQKSMKQKEDTLSAGLAARDKKLTEKVSSDIAAMRKAIDSGIAADVISLKDMTAKNADAIAKAAAGISAAKKDGASTSGSLERLKAKVEALSKVQERVAAIEARDDSLSESASAIPGIASGLAKAGERMNALEARSDGMAKSVSSLQSLKEDIAKTAERFKALDERKADAAKKFAVMEALRDDVAKAGERLNALEEKKAESAKKLSAVTELKAELAKAGERIFALEERKAETAKALSSLQDLRTDAAKSAVAEKDFRIFRASTEAALSEMRKGVEAARVEGRDKFGTAVKAFLNAKTELSGKVGLVDMKVTESEKRIGDLSRLAARMEAIERKLDRISDRGADMRRDVDQLSRKGSGKDSITLVDLGKGEEEQ